MWSMAVLIRVAFADVLRRHIDDNVVAISTIDGIGPGPTIEVIVAFVAVQRVVAASPGNDVKRGKSRFILRNTSTVPMLSS